MPMPAEGDKPHFSRRGSLLAVSLQGDKQESKKAENGGPGQQVTFGSSSPVALTPGVGDAGT